MARMVVVLPAPLGPSRPKISPWWTVQVDAVDGDVSPKRYRRSWQSTAGGSVTRSRQRISAGDAQGRQRPRSPAGPRRRGPCRGRRRAARPGDCARRQAPGGGRGQVSRDRPAVVRIGLADQESRLDQRVDQRAHRVAGQPSAARRRRHPMPGSPRRQQQLDLGAGEGGPIERGPQPAAQHPADAIEPPQQFFAHVGVYRHASQITSVTELLPLRGSAYGWDRSPTDDPAIGPGQNRGIEPSTIASRW